MIFRMIKLKLRIHWYMWKTQFNLKSFIAEFLKGYNSCGKTLLASLLDPQEVQLAHGLRRGATSHRSHLACQDPI